MEIREFASILISRVISIKEVSIMEQMLPKTKHKRHQRVKPNYAFNLGRKDLP